MAVSTMIEMNVSKEIRINRLVQEYGAAERSEFLKAMAAITKKLGGQHFLAAKEKLENGDMPSVIDILLTYYDKAYLSGLSKKQHRIKLRPVWDGTDADKFAAELIREVS
jgi:tRNA 2-selenouridine synthase